MNILIANNSVIPARLYGGTERVIWYLGKELVKKGHKVTYLVKKGSYCDFADVLFFDETQPLEKQIRADTDIVHLNFDPEGQSIGKPYVVTVHGNRNDSNLLDINSVFVSQNHAERYGSKSFVHNGLDWNDYGKPDFSMRRNYFHFLGDASWRVKNVKGAIKVITSTRSEKLAVLGGTRLNFRMGFRFTASLRVKFYGMVGGDKKVQLLKGSKGLVFPVRWHEPFGLALTESLYCGCPVFGTPYGSLPEIVTPETGFLSASSSELTNAIENTSFSPKYCSEYAREKFNSKLMAEAYLNKYETVLNGGTLNKTNPFLSKIQEGKFLNWQ